MNRQMVFLSPELMEQFGAPVNIVASIICLLSKDGQQRVTATEQFLANKSFLSTRLVSKAKRILKAHGYINIAVSSIGFKRYAVITATAKLIQAFFIPDTNGTVCDTDNAQCAISTQHSMPDRDRTECSDHTHNVRTEIAQYAVCDYAQCAVCDYAQCADKKNNKRINKRINESNGEKNKRACEETITNVSNSASTENRSLAVVEKTENPTTLTSNPPQAEEKKSSAKRKERVEVKYPKDAAEVLKLMQAWKEKHVSVEPRIQGVNLELESEKFFDYWSERNWTNKRGKIKSMNSTVATWLGFAIERVRGNFTAPAPVPAPEDDRPKISIFEAVERGLCKNLDEASALANADGWIFEDQIKNNVVDAEFEIVEDEPLALEREI